MARRGLRIQRLARREEKETIKRVVFFSVISLVIAIFLFTLGIPLLGRFADLLGLVFKGQTSVSEDATIRPPFLDELPEATNTARIKVTGFSGEGEVVKIFIDERESDETKIQDSRFAFDEVELTSGENKIRVKSKAADGKESDFSQEKIVVFDDKEPMLTVETPQDGQSFSGNNRITVSGKTDRDAQVYANNFLASVNIDGSFDVLVPVAEGETVIEIKAQDIAGNTKVEQRKINFNK
ncbi:MAG: hypothetical protein NUV69_05280 [Candidatus Curtissbacteria bacterium]|nr:hypothetical protein [Candidatus Curtissbacteria bacterium]